MVVAGVDDENVTLAHLDALLDHLGRVNLIVAYRVRQIDYHAGADEKVVQIQRGDVLARREKVDLAVEVCAQVVAMGQKLPVGTTISNCATRWRSHWASTSYEAKTGKRTNANKATPLQTTTGPATQVCSPKTHGASRT